MRYIPVPSNREKISNGKPWSPGGVTMTLFTEAQLSFGNSTDSGRCLFRCIPSRPAVIGRSS